MTLGGYSTDSSLSKAQIRNRRRSAAIASEYELVTEGDWTYCILEPAVTETATKSQWVGSARGPSRAPDGTLLEGTMLDGKKVLEKYDFTDLIEEPCVRIITYDGTEAKVNVPAELAGLPVRSIHSKAFFNNAHVQTLELPDTIWHVGSRAFSRCKNLAYLRFSDELGVLDSSVVNQCSALKKVHLPASLSVLPSRIFDTCPLEELTIPASLSAIEDRAYDPIALRKISVDQGNARYSTDGVALYSKDGSTLIKLMGNVEHYELLQGCTHIADSACKGLDNLKSLKLAQGLESIGAYALFGTGLKHVELPGSARSIGQRAFFNCHDLANVTFNEGLVEIGEAAFAHTALTEAHLPKSLRVLDRSAFDNSNIDYTDVSSFSIDQANPLLITEGSVLYKKITSGLVALCILGQPKRCEVVDGCVELGYRSFAHCEGLEEVVLPQSLRIVRARAFDACTSLSQVELPKGLKSIGARAFWETKVDDLVVGPDVSFIGFGAFMNTGQSSKQAHMRMRNLTVHADNERYYVEAGLLIERKPTGDSALMALGGITEFVIPEQVTHLCDMLFYFLEIRCLEIPLGLKFVHKRAFLGISRLEQVRFYRNDGGFITSHDFLFPGFLYPVDRYLEILAVLPDGSFFDIDIYDSWVRSCGNPELFARMTMARLENPYQLAPEREARFRAGIKDGMRELLKGHIGSHDARFAQRLESLGLLDAEAIDFGLELAGRCGESAFSAYLLQAKRRFGGSDRFDEEFAL